MYLSDLALKYWSCFGWRRNIKMWYRLNFFWDIFSIWQPLIHIENGRRNTKCRKFYFSTSIPKNEQDSSLCSFCQFPTITTCHFRTNEWFNWQRRAQKLAAGQILSEQQEMINSGLIQEKKISKVKWLFTVSW